MCRVLSCFFRLCLLAFSLLVVSGCTVEDVERNAETTKKLADTHGDLAPTEYTWVPAGISGVCSLLLGILGIIRERRKSRTLKEAILTKADQIDKLVLSAAVATENPGNVVTKFMKSDTRTRTPAEKKALHHFDAIRKGFI